MDAEDREMYRKAGKIARQALERGKEVCDIGKSYFSVVQEIEGFIDEKRAKPAFPVNISVNNIGAHYLPHPGDKLKFKKGDVVKIDVGAHIDGYIGDNALTVELGTNRYKKLIESAEEALDFAIKTLRPGTTSGDVGRNIESVIKSKGYMPIENLTGHQITKYNLHSGTSIPNVDKGNDPIKKGMVLAIEPFATDGEGKVKRGKKSVIYRLKGERNLNGEDLKFYRWIEDNFDKLPFASYWCREYSEDYKKRLQRLERFGSAMSYPTLVEAKNGVVTQREHTVIVGSNGCEIITKM